MEKDLLIIEKDLVEDEADEAEVFEWSGEEYPCHCSGDSTESTLEIGGFSVTADKVLVVRQSLFSDIFPRQTQTLKFKSKTYRIDKVVRNSNNAFMRLILTDRDKGI